MKREHLYFFVLKERPGQICFGLDDYTPATEGDTPDENPETWNDFTWEHLVNEAETLENYHIEFSKSVAPTDHDKDEPLPVWGDNAADVASILYQNPVLYARHAQEMLP